MSKQAIGRTQPPIQWVQGSFPSRAAAGGELTTHIRLVTRLRMCGAKPSHGCVRNEQPDAQTTEIRYMSESVEMQCDFDYV
jgi:hypothetical protein